MTPPSSSDDPLQTPVQFVPGVGPRRAPLLSKLRIETVEDLLWHLPRDVIDLTQVRRPRELEAKQEQSVRGRVVDIDGRSLKNGRTLIAALFDCDGEYVRGVWFNQPWIRKHLPTDRPLLVSGKPKFHQGRWEFAHPRLQPLDTDDDERTVGVLPRYPLTEGLRMEEMRRMTRGAVEQFAASIPEHLPPEYLVKQGLVRLSTALQSVHCPSTLEEYDAGRRRVLFDDLLEFQIGVALRRRLRLRIAEAPVLPVTAKINARIRRLFPFRFTEGQDRAIRQIAGDLASGRAMHRLLQADVGAGKTVVAIYAMLTAVAAGYQTALMAPTELLATQHWEVVDELLRHSRVRRRLLTGSLTAKQRTQTHDEISSGEVDLVIGTQAVIQQVVNFANLAMVVIDEQHKFGVAQRAHFSAGEQSPHVLVMTATPIPRSLCLTQFGDLDLSVISDLPPGRQRIITSRITAPAARRKAWDFIKKQLKDGRQAYVVCPRIGTAGETDPGDEIEAADEASSTAQAEQIYRELSAGELAEFRVDLVHGQQDRVERAATMDKFRDGELDVLVSTTVIEVGVDVTNATLMVIYDAHQFGLSQLHQLRGRIGRGRFQGYCFLFSEADSPEATARLAAMEATADGFEIAEKDFELRGPGDVLGVRQHGELPLRVASLVRDRELLEEARDAAFTLVDSADIDTPEFAQLKVRVLERFAKLFDLPQSG